MKILIVCEPNTFGAFQYVKGLIKYLLKNNHTVDYAYSSKRSSGELNDFLKYVVIGKHLDLKVGSNPAPGDFLALFKLAKLIKSENYDVIHSFCSKAGVLSRVLSFITKSKIFYSPLAYFGLGRPKSLKVKVFNKIERLFGDIGTTILSCDAEKVFALNTLKITSNKIKQISNGVNCEQFAPASYAEKDTARKFLGIPTGALVFGTIARYCYQKDPQTLYKAVEQLLNKYPDVYFLHIGDGEMWEEIKTNNPRIIRLKSLTPIQYFYNAIDIFVLNSRYEAYALASLEAISCNKPLVLTECPGNLDYKNYNLNKIEWVKCGDSNDLMWGMIKQIYNNKMCNHREIALQEFSSDVCYGKILEEYKK